VLILRGGQSPSPQMAWMFVKRTALQKLSTTPIELPRQSLDLAVQLLLQPLDFPLVHLFPHSELLVLNNRP